MTEVGAIYTARVSYAGPDRVDITRKSGDADGIALAPSWSLLGPYLTKRAAVGLTAEDWRAYVERYTDEMRNSYACQRGRWARLMARLAGGPLTLVCYCRDAAMCHRTVAAELLAKAVRGGARVAGEREVRS